MDAIEFREKSNEKEGDYKISLQGHDDSIFISRGMIFAGKIQSERKLVIHGEVRGYAVAGEKIHVSDTGIVEGVITSKEVCISGRARGKIQAEKALVITRTANVIGFLKSQELHVEEGARVNNKIHQSPEPISPSEDSRSSSRLETSGEDEATEDSVHPPGQEKTEVLEEQGEGKTLDPGKRLY